MEDPGEIADCRLRIGGMAKRGLTECGVRESFDVQRSMFPFGRVSGFGFQAVVCRKVCQNGTKPVLQPEMSGVCQGFARGLPRVGTSRKARLYWLAKGAKGAKGFSGWVRVEGRHAKTGAAEAGGAKIAGFWDCGGKGASPNLASQSMGAVLMRGISRLNSGRSASAIARCWPRVSRIRMPTKARATKPATGKPWAIAPATVATGPISTSPMIVPKSCGCVRSAPRLANGCARRNCPRIAGAGLGGRPPERCRSASHK